ncbi:MAG TPA: secretin N-terminal domain-containing protein [Pyrinomonadaceae bacterium]|nr:secretin N-terminal domain-containing protein [Pyrinomonadaceae bacterium]
MPDIDEMLTEDFLIRQKASSVRRQTRRAALRDTVCKLASLLLVVWLLAAPVAAFSPKGGKNYKRGLEYEASQQWEKAAEEFALAVAAEPSNPEYQLHYRRAIFNASQTFMQQGVAMSERGDHVGAYNAFRRAYGYDGANELARSMMERMLRLQLGGEGTGVESRPAAAVADATIRRTGYEARDSGVAPATRRAVADDAIALVSPRVEQLQAITYSGDLEKFVKYLARQLKLNVVFDRDFPKRNIDTDLQEVSAAQALDYIFLTQGLFFQKLSSRTILVAEQTKRPQYQQLVLRTFYLYNVEPNDARQLIQASIPPQAGRQPVITPNKSTNSITVRDTPENVRLVGQLLKSIDKERAEVVMDVNIYEVSRTDLMQFGNQLGTDASLHNLGGIQKGLSVLAGSRDVLTTGAAALAAPTALGAALVIPASTLNALQRKDNTRLVASTQVHAFDGEKSTAHIGQRVPVQTASLTSFGSVQTGDANPQPGVAPGLFGGNGFPVIQYEKTGLTLEFTPQVFPNMDVQVKMSIKSNDVSNSGGVTLTPTFTERNIEGTARIQNNRTMMIASVAQNQQSHGRQGLPVLGLVPVLGRLFTAPRRNDSQTDIVIAVTPHVMRASALTPSDEETHPSGTLQTPNSETLEAMLQEVSREEQLAVARMIPKETNVQLPDMEVPAYVPAPKALMNTAASAAPEVETRQPAQTVVAPDVADSTPGNSVTRPLAQNVQYRERQVSKQPNTAAVAARQNEVFAGSINADIDKVDNNADGDARPAPVEKTPGASAGASVLPRSAAELRLISEPQEMRAGERRQLKFLLKTDAPLGLIALSLHFDPRSLSVRSVKPGSMFSASPQSVAIRQSVTPEGLLLISAAPSAGATAITGAGVLVVVEVEAAAAGSCAMSFDAEDVHLIAVDGRKILLKIVPNQIPAGQ